MSDNFFIDNNSKICPEPQNASFGLTGLDNLFRTLPLSKMMPQNKLIDIVHIFSTLPFLVSC